MASDSDPRRGRRFVRRGYAIGVVALAVGAALAGCASSGGSSTSGAPAPAAATSAAPGGQGVAVKQTSGGVSYVTDSAGDSLYTLSADKNGQSTCSGQCVSFWPPMAGSAATGSGVTGTLTTLQRSDGTSQVVLNGHPLYLFKMDTAPGQTNGEGVNAFGGTWTLIDPSGNPITSLTGSPSQAPAGSGPGGYGGYGDGG